MQSRTAFGRSRLALFLYKIVAELIPAARAAPLASSTQSISLPTATSAASTPSADDNRDGTFQILADGTQDLAALVGVFATDSVERYAIDYNKGHISNAVATLSLLGILGYIRALVKLAMGAKACDNAGLNVSALRPLFGIPDADRLPSDEVHEVHYMQRQKLDETIFWRESRTTKHTMDSMGVLSRIQKDFPRDRGFKMAEFFVNGRGRYFRSPLPDLAVLLLSSMCVGLTSFLLVPLRKPTQTPTWSLLFATVGLFFPIFATSLTWAWVFAQEQLPPDKSNFWKAPNDVAYTRSKGSYFLLPHLRIIKTTSRSFIEAMSLIAALIAMVGYVCQYIEVRRMSARNSGIWLAAQGVLALIRMAIWVNDPDFDNHTFDKSSDISSPNLSDMQLGLIWNARIKRLCQDKPVYDPVPYPWYRRCLDENGCFDKDFSIPVWAAEALWDNSDNLHDLFTVAASIHAGLLDKEPEPLSIIHKAQDSWDMPGWLFMSWVLSHARPDELLPPLSLKLCSFSCRVILDGDWRCHVLPFWVTGGRLSDRDYQLSTKDYTIRMFGNLRSDKATLIHISGKGEYDTAESDLPSQPFTGWQSPVPPDGHLYHILWVRARESLEFLDFLGGVFDEEDRLHIEPGQKNWIRANAIHTMDLMWKDLISVLEQIPYSTTMEHGRLGNPVESVPEAFKLIKNMEPSPPEGGRG
ncbi:hypothetical protein G7Y79_00052g087680 [Physcia stellaris]|nr:hypothetical protein G7Y79_00052g087680 [Physcia stellaris]